MTSPFLELPESTWSACNSLAFAIRDRFPVSPGHTLVIPRRLVATWFDATREEQLAILELVDVTRQQLDAEFAPHGYNVGFNAGRAAGQTVFHLHVHVIPRFDGDVPDPRGGVRHVIPDRGNWQTLPGAQARAPLVTGGMRDPLLRHLVPLFARATTVRIVAAFVQPTGLDALQDCLFGALARGAHVQLLTGDYLGITHSDALERLLDWSSARSWADDGEGEAGVLEARVVEVERLPGTSRAFHPKSWSFEGPDLAVAFVGSSNVSRAALGDGIEWNLRTERARDPLAYARITESFQQLWQLGTPLSAEWIAAYAERARRAGLVAPPGEVDAGPLEPPPAPTEIQSEALAALAASREQGRQRALVVLATGLGKTWLAAFDVEALGQAAGSPKAPRVLFLAHRAELLDQAAATFRRMFRRSFPAARATWFAGEHTDLSGALVLASVQKLARPEHLARLERDAFEYVVVDEVHHADATTYRRLLDRLEPRFLLGLTATPERADDGDVLGLFDDHVAFRVDLGEGIDRGLLVPFAYFGLKDDVDYTNIPWRNTRFDPAELSRAVQTQRRMERLWQAWQEHPGSRTLVFCCSIEHAHFARDWLRERGVRVEAVHSGPGSADRDEALAALAAGRLDALCTVDLFNEGVDLPAIDRVVMLRPTESRVVFLQQLGRGLRCANDKTRLLVLDFVGNHRIFLERLRLLLSFVERPTGLRDVLRDDRPPELPPGCSLEVDLEAKAQLLALLGPPGKGEAERAYRELRAVRGERPTIVELQHAGYRPGTLRKAHGSWFEFVASEGDLGEGERRVLAASRDWLAELETTPLTKCFKLVVLEALLESEALTSGLPVDELCQRSHALLVRNPELFRDLEGVTELDDPRAPDPAAWRSYWTKNPLAAWTGANRKAGQGSFRIDAADRFVPRFSVAAEDAATLAAMTRELVDYHLAMYRARGKSTGSLGDAFECRLITNASGDPILKHPGRTRRPDLPDGEVPVRLPDGRVWQFRFAKEFVNVARPAGTARNQLPDLLRSWFGPAAGARGTAFDVRFEPSPDGWWAKPASGQLLKLPARGFVRAFPTLQAAAGAARREHVETPEAEAVRLPVEAAAPDQFALRASGDSMQGGSKPIHDGDWLLMRFARGAGLGAVEGRVALVQTETDEGAYAYQLKRVVRDGAGWQLRSDNAARPSFPATAATTPIALLVERFRPEDLAPAPGTTLAEDALAAAFGLTAPPTTGRTDGHLFLLVDGPGVFEAPDRIVWTPPDRRPGETAFVLVRLPADDADAPTWRYVGVARWSDDDHRWHCPELDHRTWKAAGGREASRELTDDARTRAEALAARILDRVGPGGWVEARGERLRIVGRAARGGLRIDGGADGFAARTVSLTDLGWVLLAQDDVARHGGVLDEARVNRLRYLAGTPRPATRWIDTGWALVLVAFDGDQRSGAPR